MNSESTKILSSLPASSTTVFPRSFPLIQCQFLTDSLHFLKNFSDEKNNELEIYKDPQFLSASSSTVFSRSFLSIQHKFLTDALHFYKIFLDFFFFCSNPLPLFIQVLVFYMFLPQFT